MTQNHSKQIVGRLVRLVGRQDAQEFLDQATKWVFPDGQPVPRSFVSSGERSKLYQWSKANECFHVSLFCLYWISEFNYILLDIGFFVTIVVCCYILPKVVESFAARRAYKRPVVKPKTAPDPVSQTLAALKDDASKLRFFSLAIEKDI